MIAVAPLYERRMNAKNKIAGQRPALQKEAKLGGDTMATRQRPRKRGESGVALILVMLAILVLTMLAAAMVFSARTETLAGYNYRIATQTEYVARAGVQAALNFLKSANYEPLPPSTFSGASSSTYYSVNAYQTLPVFLYYTSGSSAVCCGPGATTPVFLGRTSGSSNYPPLSATKSVDVVSNWITYVNSSPYNAVSDGLGGTGTFQVTATLVDYHTVNNAFFGVVAAGCSDALAGGGICRQPNETWLVKSVGTWNSNIGSTASPTVEVDATIAPMFLPYFGNALYGLCNVTLNGNTCTDAYNSLTGSYSNTAGSGGINDITTCAMTSGGAGGGSTGNAQPLGAGVGSNGGVTINGSANYIGGNVSYANQGSSSSCDTGFSGTATGVAGTILPGPAIPPPPDLTAFMQASPLSYPRTAPAVNPPNGGVSNIYLRADLLFSTKVPAGLPPLPGNAGDVVSGTDSAGNPFTYTVGGATPTACPAGSTAYVESYTESNVTDKKTGTSYNLYSNYTCTGVSGTGSGTNPYLLGDVTATSGGGGNQTINFIAPKLSDTGTPPVVAMNSIDIGNHGIFNTSNVGPTYPTGSGAMNYTPNPSPPLSDANAPGFVMDVYTSVTIGGQSNLNCNPATPGIPSPMFLTINIEGTGTALTLQGQGELNGTINIPNGNASLGGGGSTGVMFGSILAKNISNGGHYPVHYDISASRISGQLFTAQVVSVTRPKY